MRCKINSLFKARFINELLVVVLVIITITPDLAIIVSPVIKIVIVALWYVVIFAFEKEKVSNSLKLIIFSFLLWIAYDLVLALIGYSHAAFGNYLNKIIFFDIIIVSIYIKNNFNEIQKNFILRSIQLIVVGNVMYMLYINSLFPEVYITTVNQDSLENIIGFNVPNALFYNSLAFVISWVTVDAICSKRTIIKITDYCCIGLSYCFMLTCSPRATALSFSVLLIIGAIYIFSQHKKAYLCLGLLLCFISIIFVANINIIISYLPERIAIRYLALLGESGGDTDTLGRFGLMMNSITSFIYHPIFGVGYLINRDLTNIIGQHSLIFDFLGWYGVIGLIFLIYFYNCLYRNLIINTNNNNKRKFCKYLFYIYFLLSFNSNTFMPVVGTGAFLLLSCSTKNKVKSW